MYVVDARNFRLGDIVQLGDRSKRVVRAVIDPGSGFPTWVVVGAFEAVIEVPPGDGPYRVLTPTPAGFGVVAPGSFQAAAGVSSWLSSHLPPAPNTLATVAWQYVNGASRCLILYRASEPLVMVEVGTLDRSYLFGLHLPLTEDPLPLSRMTGKTAPRQTVAAALVSEPI